jgi:hypothetical protein
MGKWEYQVIRSYGGVVMVINGNTVGKIVANQPVGVPLFEYLNQVGEDGWEVVGMAGVREGIEVVLKRPPIEEPEE